MSEGIWTMTDSEFQREMAKAWDEGVSAGRRYPADAKSRNPYRSARGKSLSEISIEAMERSAGVDS